MADLAIDFGPSGGLWAYYEGRGPSPPWQQLHNVSPSILTRGDLDGNGREDVVVDFTGYGVWVYMNNATWAQLDARDASAIKIGDLDGNGRDDAVIDFPDSASGRSTTMAVVSARMDGN